MIDCADLLKCDTGTKITRTDKLGRLQFATIVDLVPYPDEADAIQVLSRDGWGIYHIDRIKIGCYNTLMIIERVSRADNAMKTYLEALKEEQPNE